MNRMKENGCDISKMHEYFGYKNTQNNIRSIKLKRDQNVMSRFYLTIKSKKRDYQPVETYIKNLPGDVNNLIYSYLHTVKKLKFTIQIPHHYPYDEPKWSLTRYTENGVEKRNYDFEPNYLYCGGDYLPSMFFDKEILIYVTKLDWFNED